MERRAKGEGRRSKVEGRRKLARGILLALFLINLFGAISPALALTTNEVAKEFICNCGCQKMLNACDMTCGEQLRGVIIEKIEQGWSKEKIVAYMMKNYGESLLAAPTKKGFNLTAWITPFVVAMIGGVLLYLMIKRWARRGRELEEVEKEEVVAKEVGLGYEDKLEDELKKFEY